MNPTLQLSEEELISYLKKTSIPTILVEGSSDAEIYRAIESDLPDAAILSTGGRASLLNIFERKDELRNTAVLFLADRDMWLFTATPANYQAGVILTDGYSIENTIYNKDLVEGLMSQTERIHFISVIESLSLWFAHEVDRFIKTGTSQCAKHIDQIILRTNQITPSAELFPAIQAEISPPKSPQLAQEINASYTKKLRGKTLFQAVLRVLSHSSRRSKYSAHNLYEICAKNPSTEFRSVLTQIQSRFSSSGEVDSCTSCAH